MPMATVIRKRGNRQFIPTPESGGLPVGKDWWKFQQANEKGAINHPCHIVFISLIVLRLTV
jgi:hypothetical protein